MFVFPLIALPSSLKQLDIQRQTNIPQVVNGQEDNKNYAGTDVKESRANNLKVSIMGS